MPKISTPYSQERERDHYRRATTGEQTGGKVPGSSAFPSDLRDPSFDHTSDFPGVMDSGRLF